MKPMAIMDCACITPYGNTVVDWLFKKMIKPPLWSNERWDYFTCEYTSVLHELPINGIRKMDRPSTLALATLGPMLLRHNFSSDIREQMAVIFATTFGSYGATYAFASNVLSQGMEYASPIAFPNIVQNMPLGQLAIQFGLHGPATMISSTLAGGLQTLMMAARLFETQQTQQAIVGSIDACNQAFDGFLYPNDKQHYLLMENSICFLIEANPTHEPLCIVKDVGYRTASWIQETIRESNPELYLTVSLTKSPHPSYETIPEKMLSATGLFEIINFIYQSQRKRALIIHNLPFEGAKKLVLLLEK